jgi:chemotaxis protein MotB
MRWITGFVLLIIIPFFTLACGGNKQVLAQKDSEIARLRAELASYRAKKVQLDQLDADLKKSLAELENKRMLTLDGNQIILSDAVLFPSGSATITGPGKGILDETWHALRNYTDREILIEGHTDDVPIAPRYRSRYKSNWELSCTRALSVLHYLLGKTDADPSRFGAIGFGEHRPVADNTTAEGRHRNRRVVIVVTRQ